MKPLPLEKDSGFLQRTIASLTDQIDLFETFQSLSLKIISQFDLENIFSTFAGIVKEVIHYQEAQIYLFDPRRISFQVVWQSEKGVKNADPSPMLDEKIVSWVMEQGRWTVITDLQEEANLIESILPIKSPKNALGFMVIQTHFTPSLYSKKTGSILEFLASQAAIAVENQDLYARLNQSNAYMTDLMESISNGIMATDLSGRITMINKNATAILGITAKKILGCRFDSLVSGVLKKKLGAVFKQALDDNLQPEIMINHAPFKEVEFFIGITTSLLTDKDKKTMGVIFSIRDMSASKEIERLTRLDQMKSEFVSNVSHELRTPLSIIKSYTEALISQVDPEDLETREKFLTVIDDETDRLSGIVSNLLDLSRIESGKFTLDIGPVDMIQLVNSVIKTFSPKLDKIQIFTQFQEDLPLIQADAEKINEVLINLVSNSIKFSPMGGTIHITLEVKKAHMICSVADTGIGIPKNQLRKIFDKFYRVDNSDTYEIEGTGLGLPIVKHILERHKGRIEVDSAFGKGSIFTFLLPVTKG